MKTEEVFKLLKRNYYKPNPIKNGAKKCTICLKDKPIQSFCSNQKYPDKRHVWCKQCTYEITANREIQKSFARPLWSVTSQEHQRQISRLEAEAKRLTKATKKLHSVCHIEPLQHWLICGLDIPANMYVDTQANNAKESNFFLPYTLFSDGRIEQIELSERSIVYAFNFNERFNQKRNDNYRQSDKKCA